MTTTVIVPTFNERDNIEELVRRLTDALRGCDAEVLFVDDSTDDTPEVIARAAASGAGLPIRLLHREPRDRSGGLAGAVTAGMAISGDRIVAMDGDLQHPPELVPVLLAELDGADVVVASRYTAEGEAAGLASGWRRMVSNGSTLLAQACFPRRVGRVCSDPMTGFFAFRRTAIDLGRLRPRGFKILLEILARHDLKVRDVPFSFGDRTAGCSKASWRQGVAFAYQLLSLRMGRMSRFAAVGALGTFVNLAVMWLCLLVGTHYLVAAVAAAEISIMHNFLMQERFVFRDLTQGSTVIRRGRCLLFLSFNNAEAVARMPILALLVAGLGQHPLLAQAFTLAVAFVIRFLFVSHLIYRPQRNSSRELHAPALQGELS